MEGITVCKHPLIQHKLTLIRDKNVSTQVISRTTERDWHAVMLRGHPRSAPDEC